MSLGHRLCWIVALLLWCSSAATGVQAELAYSVLKNGSWRIYRQVDTGSVPREQWGGLEMDASAPAISPSGTRIAFEVSGQDILVCPLARGGRCCTVKNERGSAVRPTWDSRSGELVFVRYLADAQGEDSDIVITRNSLEAEGPLVSQTGNQDDPDLSPDGDWLIYSSAQTISLHRAGVQVVRHLWLMDLKNGVARPLAPGSGLDMHPDFSPDSKHIIFASDRTEEFEIWVVGAAGDGLRKVTSGPGAKTWPAWSPDGKSIMYVRTHEGRQGLWIAGADGSNPTPFEPFGPDADVQIRDPDWR